MSEKSLKKKGKVRQHFVPRFYLKNFGEKIYCYDKKEERKFSSDPGNVAVKADFYGGEFEGHTSIENLFAEIENQHSRAVKKLLEVKDYYKLDKEHRISICEFFAFQFLRTESRRKDMNFMFNEFINFAAQKLLPKDLKVELTEKSSIGRHLNTIKDYKKFAVLFYNMKFIVYENHTPIPFWTSDNPITKQNELDTHPLGNLGITNQGIEIHLPLSPKILVWATDPISFEWMPNTHNIYIKQNIIRENFLQLKFSSRFIYSSTSRFHLIKSMIKDNPHYKDGAPKNEIMTAETEKGTIFMTSERNDRWSLNDRKEVMGKLATWIEPKKVDELLGINYDD